MSNTFYRKYRPQNFSDVVGQKHIVTTLTNALKLGRVGQAYLFTGPRGTGKTTLARLFAKAINCENRKDAEPCGKCQHCLLMAEGRSLDVIEIDAASHTGVDNIRELRETVKLPPTLGSHKIYIIDEVHMLSIGAFNALLKTLEEPPAHVVFILATTALHKVPDTIVSRCQRFDLSRFPLQSIIDKLSKIAKAEKLKIDDAALRMIAQTAEGGMRDAESLLMQIASLSDSKISEDTVVEVLGTTKKETVASLLTLIGNKELFPSLAFIRNLAQDGTDLSIFGSVILHYLRDLLLISANKERALLELDMLSEEEKSRLVELASLFTPNQIIEMLEHFQVAQIATKTAVISELPLEIAIVKILSEENDSSSSLPPKTPSSPPRTSPVTQTPPTSSPVAPTSETPKKSEAKTATKNTASVSGVPEERNEETGSIDLSSIRERWSAILDTAKRVNASLTLALSTARPLETRGSTVVIAVKYPFHKERLEETQNQLTLKEAFDTILGQKLKVAIVLEEQAATQNESKQDFLENPLVSQAMEMLGGRIVEGA